MAEVDLSEVTNFSDDCGGSSENEADTEGEEPYPSDLDDELREMMEHFQPYMFEPEKDTSCSSSEEDTTDEPEDPPQEDLSRVGNLDWCKCSKCSVENRKIDCLCCQEVAALNSKFDEGNLNCVVGSVEFETLCLNKLVLLNVLTGLHESRGDFIEANCSNRSFRYAAYKQFIWWVFKNLGKGNRRVIPSCVLWKIRNSFPEPNGIYVLYSEGRKDGRLRVSYSVL